MGKPLAKRVARRIQAHFDIPYTQALKCFHDTVALPDIEQRLLKHGGFLSEAMFDIALDVWEFEGGELCQSRSSN